MSKILRFTIAIFLVMQFSFPGYSQTEKASLIEKVQKLNEMYSNYNKVDDVYDTVIAMRKKIEISMANIVALNSLKINAETVKFSSSMAEDCALEAVNIVEARDDLEKESVNGELLDLKKISLEMVSLSLEEYDIYKEFRSALGNLDEMLKVNKKRIQTDSKYEHLHEKYAKEQTRLLQKHETLTKEIVAALN